MAQLITQPYKNIEINIAYRNYNLQTKFNSNSFQRNPLTPVNRIFVNTNIEILKHWDWDFTVSWSGKSRIPNTAQNEVEWQLKSSSDPFLVANSQLKFEPNDTWNFYLGGENLFNYQQSNPILGAENPFQENFDASLIWGPIFGRRIYGGFKLQF
jgi:outer membrane receptor protein involved in Fe transport